MKSLIENLPIEYWTDNGTPYAETRRHMSERSDNECNVAALFFTSIFPLPPDTIDRMLSMAMMLRSTVKVLDKFDPVYRVVVAECEPEITPLEIDRIMECHALFLECIVRLVNKEVPPCKG